MNSQAFRFALSVSLALVPLVQVAAAQAGDHRWAGRVSDPFVREVSGGDVEGWTVEDGGRIRYRDSTSEDWAFQGVPDEVKDILFSVFFLDGEDDEYGWAVGQGGWVLKTDNYGTTWTVLGDRIPSPIENGRDPWEELRDVHFLDP